MLDPLRKLRKRVYDRQRYLRLREHYIEKARRWQLEKPEVRRAAIDRYHQKYPERRRAYGRASSSKRRARLKGCDVSNQAASALIARWHLAKTFICYFCGGRFPTSELEIDHVTPLSKGGRHSMDNLCRSCSGCNNKKHAKLITENIVNGQCFLL